MSTLKLASIFYFLTSIFCSVYAATIIASFNPDAIETIRFPFRASESASEVVRVTVADTAHGGVEISFTATGLVDGVGSVFISGLDPTDFSGDGFVFPGSSSSQGVYGQAFGLSGAIFAPRPNNPLVGYISGLSGDVSSFASVQGINISTDSFLGATIGIITVFNPNGHDDSPAGLYQGVFQTQAISVPVPETLPMLLAAFGAFGFVRTRKRLGHCYK